VTFSPLCESVVAFDRRAHMDRSRFGVSGLLYNSNTLLYDDRENDQEESLWCQIQARAIAGPAAARRESLDVLPVAVVHWSYWRERHPETTVLAPDYAKMHEYRRDPYGSYSSSELLRFPVDPLPPADGPEPKKPFVIVRDGGYSAYSVESLVRLAGRDGIWIDGSLRFRCRDQPPTVHVERVTGGPPDDVRYAYWFAWYATHREEGMKVMVP
jgi:hypothetical protein